MDLRKPYAHLVCIRPSETAMGAETGGAVSSRCAPDAERPLMLGVLEGVLKTGGEGGRDVCRRRDRRADSYAPAWRGT
jgi:hypothetical protein